MILFLVLLVVLLMGLTAAAVMGKLGGFLADPTSSQSFAGIRAGHLSTDDIAHLHFDQALRGYRMDQVDDVIDALSARLAELESDVGSLGATGASSAAAGDSREASPDSSER